MKRIFYVILVSFLTSIAVFGESMPRGDQEEIGSWGKILKYKNKRALLYFPQKVLANKGQVFRTEIKNTYFKVLNISPQKNKVFGLFNKEISTQIRKVFLYKLLPVEEERQRGKLSSFSFSLFYTFSFGDFTEKVGEASAESSQNSPYTFGLSLNYRFNNSLSYSGSAYFSKLNSVLPSGVGDSSKDNAITIPWEYGLTSYLEFSGINFFLKPYLGLDFESFSTFNTDELKEDSNISVSVRTHQFLYGTIGLFSYTKIFSRPGIFKASFSKNFTSSSSRDSTVSNKLFNGQKFILFFGTNVWGNWGVSALYKRHMMTGPTDLTISRFGFGVSYRF